MAIGNTFKSNSFKRDSFGSSFGVDSFGRTFVKSNYKYKAPVNKELDALIERKTSEHMKLLNSLKYGEQELPNDRGGLRALLDFVNLPNYAIAGAAKGLFDDGSKNDVGVVEGFLKGASAGITGNDKYRYSFSEVLEEMGWKPESGLGKFAKGATGLFLDIMLDPTTYMTGGLSTIVRGSGKASSKLIAKKISSDLFEEAFQKGLKEGLDEGASRLMAKELVDETLPKLEKLELFQKGMTKENAEAMLNKFESVAGKAFDAEEKARLLEKLPKEFNKLFGISRKNPDLTISLKNMPFGEKFFPNAKVWTLADAETMNKIGDATLAPLYSKIRHTYLSRNVSSLFSGKSFLYKRALRDPEAVLDLILHADYSMGNSASKKLADASVLEKAKELFGEMTPHENKQILELLENKNAFTRATKYAKYYETSTGQIMKSKMVNNLNKTVARFENLVKEKSKVVNSLQDINVKMKEVGDLLDVNMGVHQIEIENLDKQYAQVKDLGEGLLKSKKAELSSIDAKLAELTGKVAKSDGTVPEGILKEVEELSLIRERISKGLDVLDGDEGLIALINREKRKGRVIDTFVELTEEYGPTFLLDKHYINKVDSKMKENFLDALSEYVFNQKGVFTELTDLKLVKKTADMVLEGASIADIRKLLDPVFELNTRALVLRGKEGSKSVRNYIDSYKAHLKDLGTSLEEASAGLTKELEGVNRARYSYIAREVGYKSWKDDYLIPMPKLEDKLKVMRADINKKMQRAYDKYVKVALKRGEDLRGDKAFKRDFFKKHTGDFVTEEYKMTLHEYNRLKAKAVKRAELLADTRGIKNQKEWQEYISRKYNKDASKSLAEIQEEGINSYRDTFVDEVSADAKRKTNHIKMVDNYDRLAKKEFLLESDKVKIREKIHSLINSTYGRNVEGLDELIRTQHLVDGNVPKVAKLKLGRFTDANKAKIYFERKISEKSLHNRLSEMQSYFSNYKNYLKALKDGKPVSAMDMDGVNRFKQLMNSNRFMFENPEVASNYIKHESPINIEDIYLKYKNYVKSLKGGKSVSGLDEYTSNLFKELANSNKLELSKAELASIYKKPGSTSKLGKKMAQLFDDMFTHSDEILREADVLAEKKAKQAPKLVSNTPLARDAYDKIVSEVEEMITESTQHYIEKSGRPSFFSDWDEIRQDKIIENAFDNRNKWRYNKEKAAQALLEKQNREALLKKSRSVDDLLAGDVEKELASTSEITKEFLEDTKLPKHFDKDVINDEIDRRLDDLYKKYDELTESGGEVLGTVEDLSEMKRKVKTDIFKLEEELSLERSKYYLDKRLTNNLYDNQRKVFLRDMDILERESARLQHHLKTDKDMLQIEKLREKIRIMSKHVESDMAFEAYVEANHKSHYHKVIKEKGRIDTGEVLLDRMLQYPEKVRLIAKQVHDDMAKIGQDEVLIGKLGKEQYEEGIKNYIAHILTPEGEAFVKARNKAMSEGVNLPSNESWAVEFGFGKTYNPHAFSRTLKHIPDVVDESGNVVSWIDNPTISQINDYMLNTHGIKQFMMDNVADIYLSRMYKHNELMYDYHYTNTMLDMFGKSYEDIVRNRNWQEYVDLTSGKNLGDDLVDRYNLKPREGYSFVANHQQLKTSVHDNATMEIALEIDEAVKDYMKPLREKIRSEVKGHPKYIEGLKSGLNKEMQQKLFGELYSEINQKYYKAFVDEKYPLEVQKAMRIKKVNEALNMIGIEDIEKMPNTPMLKISDTTNVGRLGSRLNRNKEDFYELLQKREANVKLYGANAGYMERLAKSDEVLKRSSKGMDALKETRFPVYEVADEIVNKANHARKLQSIRDESRFLKLYDKALHLIKINQTSVMVPFHMRNKFFSNLFQNWLAIGYEAGNPKFHIGSTKAMMGKTLNSTDGLLIKGKMTSWSDIRTLAEKYNILDVSFADVDFQAITANRGLFDGKIPGKFDPTSSSSFLPYKLGTKVGSTIENSDKLLQFGVHLKNGKSAEEAAELVTKYLFDYGDLTEFEKVVMKRIFPYYTWMRKNVPLQLEQIMMQPQKYSLYNKVLRGIEGMTEKEDRIDKRLVNDFAKNWIQLPFNVTNPRGKEEVMMFNPNTPVNDLDKLPNPFGMIDWAKDMFANTTPIAKVPIEQAVNKNFFFDSPITEEGDSIAEKGGKRLNHIFSQSAPYSTARDLVQKKGLDRGLQALNSLTGIKLLSYDYDTFKSIKLKQIYEHQDRVRDLKKKGMQVVDGFADMYSMAYVKTEQKVLDKIGEKPDALNYGGALRPISSETYNSLSEEEKKKYTPPTNKQAFSYSLEAQKLARSEMEKSGVAKELLWTLFDGKPSDKSEVGRIVKVVDGDTVDVKVGDEVKRVRLLLVDTPETSGEGMFYGQEAKDFSQKALFDKDVTIHFSKEKDYYGRYLGFVEVGGEDFNKSLLSEGMAKMRYVDRKGYSKLDEYTDAQMEAYKRKLGVFSKGGYALNDDYSDYRQ